MSNNPSDYVPGNARTVVPGQPVGYHDGGRPEPRVENLEHDSLFVRFEQLERLLEDMSTRIKIATGSPEPHRRVADVMSLVRLIRKQVLK